MTSQPPRKVIVIGAGPAGLMAAGQAAAAGARVLLLEKTDSPGAKLAVTGNGRGNVTNVADIDEFAARFNGNSRIVKRLLSAFGPRHLIEFFEQLALPTVAQDDGRVFPVRNRAKYVVEALVAWIGRCGVELAPHCAVESLCIEGGAVTGLVALHADGASASPQRRTHTADAVVVATGGRSYPHTGSTGDGFALAAQVGHRVAPLHPGLVPLLSAGATAQELQGLGLADVKISLLIDGKKQRGVAGDMLFTHYGVSGPAILCLSRWATAALSTGQTVEISIDLAPHLDERDLDSELLARFREQGVSAFSSAMKGLLPKRLVEVCATCAGISAATPCHRVSADQRKRLRLWLKHMRLSVTGHRGFDEAMITAGGVDLSELHSATLESRLVRGLHFAGEVLDVDADTGGYNLQLAFSSGYVAGKGAARHQRLEKE